MLIPGLEVLEKLKMVDYGRRARNVVNRQQLWLHLRFTFVPLLLLLHRLAILLQLLVCELVEGVGILRADDHLGLILLFDDGLGCRHELPLQDTQRNSRNG